MAGITHRGAPRVERNRYGSAAGQQRWSKPAQALSKSTPKCRHADRQRKLRLGADTVLQWVKDNSLIS